MGAVGACGFKLPWPPSVNHYYRHVGPRVLISRDGRRYRERVAAMVGGREPFEGELRLTAEFYPPDRRRRDLDNLLKSLQDALQHAGLYRDDSQIAELRLRRREPLPPDGLAYIRIEDMNDAKRMEGAD